ncbi:MAG: threonine synthase [Acidimicrobiia bacterium]|jgi:threonine synthase
MTVFHLECLLCGRTFEPKEVEYVCPDHGDDGVLDVVYDYETIGAGVERDSIRPDSMWDYRPLLPVAADAPLPPLRVGGTPLYETRRLAGRIGLEQVWVKDEGVQPTGSLKDRASAMALVKADELGAAVLTTASTGNAAAALSGLAASVGRDTVIFVPASAPEAKVAQLLAFGATVLLVEGSYNDAIELCLRASERFGWYNRTTGFNPYMSEGKKTVAYEVVHQLGWEAPDVIVVSVGDGCIIGSLWKGFHDLIELGWVERMPRMIGVQATGSDFLAQAWENDENVLDKPPIQPATIADSISAALPRDRVKAMRAVTASDGAFVTVTDEAILSAIPTLASTTGVFAEPAAAAAWAGAVRAVELGLVTAADRVVVLSTGTGLKDIPAAMRSVSAAGLNPHRIPPDIEAVAAELEEPTT